MIYLDTATPICYTVLPGPSILISHGFIEELTLDDLQLVVRHELEERLSQFEAESCLPGGMK